ncbi:Met-10+ like-protein-domain-containing protein [Scleroderma yunnanense]
MFQAALLRQSTLLRTVGPLRRQNMQPALDISPPVHRGMESNLDRSAFQKSIPVLAVRIATQQTALLLRSDALKSYIIDIPKIRSVVWDPSAENDRRLVLLKITEQAALSPEARTFLIDHSAEIVEHTINLDYNYWTADDILQAVLPEHLLDGSPTGFSVIGHIAHMNLNKEYLPYKKIIGQVILDKNPAIKTVVNKLDSIDNTFRFFKMELLAGEPNYIVEHHESNCRFIFDFSKVYWNSRLHTEHDRLVQLFKPEDVVADVFAGVGPFAIPAARKGCAVLANDLNPDSVHYLSKNIAINDVADLVQASCEDGREFIRSAAFKVTEKPFRPYAGPMLSRVKEKRRRREAQALEQNEEQPASTNSCSYAPTEPPRQAVTRFVMNLPDSALDFLDAFQGILATEDSIEGKLHYAKMPMIHCYCFTRELEPDKAEMDILLRAEARLGHRIEEDVCFHLVRSVAPNKDMYCISFRLPHAVAFGR